MEQLAGADLLRGCRITEEITLAPTYYQWVTWHKIVEDRVLRQILGRFAPATRLFRLTRRLRLGYNENCPSLVGKGWGARVGRLYSGLPSRSNAMPRRERQLTSWEIAARRRAKRGGVEPGRDALLGYGNRRKKLRDPLFAIGEKHLSY